MRAFFLSAAIALGVLAPGLSSGEHATLARQGAFGQHPVRVLLLGDSIALTLGIGLTKGAHANYGIAINNHSTLGCDLDPQLEILTSGKPGPATPGCGHWQALWPFLTASVQPDVVILGVGRWEVSAHFYRGQWVHIGDKSWDDHVAADLRQAIGIFHTFGAKVVLLTMPYIDPSNTQPDGQPWPENSPAYAARYNQLVRQVATADPGTVTVIDINKLLGPKGVYTQVVDGVAVRWSDGIHVSTAGGEYLQHLILPEVARLGLQAKAAVAKSVARVHAASQATTGPLRQP